MNAATLPNDVWIVITDLPAEPPPYMPAWNDTQIRRFQFRVGLFQRRGMAESAAELFADRLATRDHERDSRRACVECESVQKGNTCFKRHPVLLTQLMRCDGFSFQTP